MSSALPELAICPCVPRGPKAPHGNTSVLDTGATISIMAKKILPRGVLKNAMPTTAIGMGDGHVVHSYGDREVDVPMGSRSIGHRFYVMDTEAFNFVLGTDFFVDHPPGSVPHATSALCLYPS